jgi:hypothetical protein
MFNMIPCREIRGDCTASIGSAVVYIYIGVIHIISLGKQGTYTYTYTSTYLNKHHVGCIESLKHALAFFLHTSNTVTQLRILELKA